MKQIKLACYLNLALCHLKKPGREDKVIHNCDDALAIDPNNVKVFFLFFLSSSVFFFSFFFLSPI